MTGYRMNCIFFLLWLFVVEEIDNQAFAYYEVIHTRVESPILCYRFVTYEQRALMLYYNDDYWLSCLFELFWLHQSWLFSVVFHPPPTHETNRTPLPSALPYAQGGLFELAVILSPCVVNGALGKGGLEQRRGWQHSLMPQTLNRILFGGSFGGKNPEN